jgi:pimeloyl-ACP methyl ester carboxylesterase
MNIRIFNLIVFILFSASCLYSQTKKVSPLPVGKMMDVGGYRLHYKLTKSKGTVPVVFISGLRDYSFVWDLVEPEIRKTNTTLLYDRAGYAWSDADTAPRSLQRAVNELHVLITKLNIQMPFVIVAHSWGGHIARVFYNQYPDMVSGMVLIESSHEDKMEVINGKLITVRKPSHDELEKEFQEEMKAAHIQDSLNALKSATDKKAEPPAPNNRKPTVPFPYSKLSPSDQKLFLWARTKWAEDISDYQEPLQLVNATRTTRHPLNNIPLVVLSSERPLEYEKDWPEYKYSQQLNAEKTREQADLATLSTNSKHITTNKSGHHIQLEEPALVVKSIYQVTTAALRKQMLK